MAALRVELLRRSLAWIIRERSAANAAKPMSTASGLF